jgi:hypothetical protein
MYPIWEGHNWVWQSSDDLILLWELEQCKRSKGQRLKPLGKTKFSRREEFWNGKQSEKTARAQEVLSKGKERLAYTRRQYD